MDNTTEIVDEQPEKSHRRAWWVVAAATAVGVVAFVLLRNGEPSDGLGLRDVVDALDTTVDTVVDSVVDRVVDGATDATVHVVAHWKNQAIGPGYSDHVARRIAGHDRGWPTAA